MSILNSKIFNNLIPFNLLIFKWLRKIIEKYKFRFMPQDQVVYFLASIKIAGFDKIEKRQKEKKRKKGS